MGRDALSALGHHPFAAQGAMRTFRKHDMASLNDLRETYNSDGVSTTYIDAMRTHAATLFDLMSADRAERHDRTERGWTPPPKGDASL